MLIKTGLGLPLGCEDVTDVISSESAIGNVCNAQFYSILIKESIEPSLNSSVDIQHCRLALYRDPTSNGTAWHVVRLGPVRRESPPSPRSNCALQASLSLLHLGQSSNVALHVVLVQRRVDPGHSSPSSICIAVGS